MKTDESDQKKLSSDDISSNPGPQVDTKPAPADTTAGQNDTRKPENVDADESAGDVTGPGPKPLDTVAKEHGGDAGNDATKAAAAADGDDSTAKDTAADTAADSGEQGTGEQYVKTSGLAADGGDFDATKPGAGREADRETTQSCSIFLYQPADNPRPDGPEGHSHRWWRYQGRHQGCRRPLEQTRPFVA